MNLERLSIGQMAELNGVTKQTLRHYDNVGVLHPYFVDDSNGYRYYHINQSARLDMISYLQSTGASLEEIGKILGDTQNFDNLLTLLKQRLEYIDLEIQRANQSKNTIKRYILNYEKYNKIYFDQSIFMEYIPERYIYSVKTDFDYFKQGSIGYEMMMRELKHSFYKERMPICLFCNVGTIIRKDYVLREKLHSNEAFIFVEEPFELSNHIEKIAENWYISVCSDDFDKEQELAEMLFDYLKQNNYVAVGDYLCEVIRDFPDFGEKPRKTFYKIQIPVSKC